MKKKDLKYYIFIVLILLTIIIVEILKPKQIDRRFTLEQKDKIPYGTYVLFNTINDIFPGKEILLNKKTIWEFVKEENNAEIKNYIFITELFKIEEPEISTLLDLAEKGNNIFISAHRFEGIFSDTLKFTSSRYLFSDTISKLNFYNQKIKTEQPFVYKKSAGFVSFTNLDTANCKALAYDQNQRIIFFRQAYGNGFFYFNSTPEVFTNYAMITEKNYAFAYKALSYLPVKKTVWDEYRKPFRKVNKTALSFFLGEKSLKTAYYMLLLTTLFFVFFTAKRKQRIIPIIKPHKNKTPAFVRTISGLYHKTKNYKDIAQKRFTYLNNFLKQKYNVNLIDSENTNIKKIAQKTGTDTNLLKKLLSYNTKINKNETISSENLIIFNKIIEDIYKTCE